jgi:hypothetical protein
VLQARKDLIWIARLERFVAKRPEKTRDEADLRALVPLFQGGQISFGLRGLTGLSRKRPETIRDEAGSRAFVPLPHGAEKSHLARNA